ncbi:MAG: sigma factor-like helix-turn-helix DNA-binding protein [Thermoleophilaceae bacterium]
MATFDQLSAPQRAIIELVLQRGKTYDELSGMLGMPEARVRELARDALVKLAPVSARQVDEEWQGQLADYILGQQAGPESTATRGHLRRSESARSWARSLLDSLETLYEDGAEPSIPDAERGRRERPARPAREKPVKPRRERPEGERRFGRRALLAAAGILAALALVAVLVWPVGVLTGDNGKDTKNASAGGSPNVAACPSRSTPARSGPAGLALIAERSGRKQVIVQAGRLPPNRLKGKRPQDAYEVWLYNSPSDARAIGAQVTDRKGNYQGAGALPANYRRYACVDLSLEPLDSNQAHSGQSVLRGRLLPVKEPSPSAASKGALLGRIILTPPPR